MNFGREHVVEESVASRCGIRHIPLDSEEAQKYYSTSGDEADRELDRMALHAANKAARVMILGIGSMPPKDGEKPTDEAATAPNEDLSLINTAHYKRHILPPQKIITEGDLVVIMIGFDNLDFVYAEKDAIVSNRNGHFHHNDFLGKPFGCKIRSRNNQGYGYCYLLKPTPELWIRSLNHRTQIVHDLDQSQIVFQLQLRPNTTVIESGTGSGAMSHAILRSIAPHGHLHTYEFNPHRADVARHEFELHGLSSLVTVRHRDVCATGFDGCQAGSVDAVFLDLPEPWRAVEHAAYCLKPNGRLANYSPCIEQTQRVVLALEKAGFHSIQTMEYRLMEHYVDNVTYQPPPKLIRPCLIDKSYDPSTIVEQQKRKESPAENADVPLKKAKLKVDTEKEETQTSQNGQTSGTAPASKAMLVARPFGSMRGHTAFLTFATAGLAPQTQPSLAAKETVTTS